MKNLIIYIIIFMMVIFGVTIITTYFKSNINVIEQELSSTSEYTKLNLYFLKTIKKDGIKIKSYGLTDEDFSSYYITFEELDGSKNTFIKVNNIIYFNNIKLCDDVQEFKVIVDKSNKESISVDITMSNEVYKLQYVVD